VSAETFTAADWIFDTLNADEDLAGKVHHLIAPARATPPYVVYQEQSGIDVATANGSRIMANLLYLVRVISAGRSLESIKALANTVDELLQRASGSNASGEVISCTREGQTTRAYTASTGEYREIVFTFRLFAQGA